MPRGGEAAWCAVQTYVYYMNASKYVQTYYKTRSSLRGDLVLQVLFMVSDIGLHDVITNVIARYI